MGLVRIHIVRCLVERGCVIATPDEVLVSFPTRLYPKKSILRS